MVDERFGTDCEQVDVLIVGSGPVGATFARRLADRHPGATILILDAGPQITTPPGAAARNLTDAAQFDAACRAAEGRDPRLAPGDVPPGADSPKPFSTLARGGTHLLAAVDGDAVDVMPAAAMSTCVGGMMSFWTCATPRPAPAEAVPFLPAEAWSAVLDEAEILLGTSADVFAPSWQSERVFAALATVLGGGEEATAPAPRMMPFACRRLDDGSHQYSGVDGILGDLSFGLLDKKSRVRLRAETLCCEILHEDGHAAGVLVTDMRSGRRYGIRASVVIVAADALRSPQLLWASGIRPKALGRHLNEHAMIMSRVVLRAEGEGGGHLSPARRLTPRDPMTTVMWIPFAEQDHPIHGQLAHFDEPPAHAATLRAEGYDVSGTIGLTHFCRKEIRFADHVAFDAARCDAFGMPAGRITYTRTAQDRRAIESAEAEQRAIADALGRFVPGEEPRAMPVGTSLHYQGTLRMGEADDGASVCDPASCVWGFDNLFVGGNGVIPTATACNPTLFSVALAVLAADGIKISCQADAVKIKEVPAI